MISWLKQTWQTLSGQSPQPASGQLFVVAAPSGAGKTSLVKALIKRHERLSMSVSYTTRPRRDTEEHGRDYLFVDKVEFERLKAHDDLLEFAQVFDNYYATGRSQVERLFQSGHDVVLEIDWQGARQVKMAMPHSQSIFILPPSRAALEQRLRGRSTDSDEVIARRLRDSVSDMSHWNEFDYVVVNDNFDKAVNELSMIVQGNGAALASDRGELKPLLSELLG